MESSSALKETLLLSFGLYINCSLHFSRPLRTLEDPTLPSAHCHSLTAVPKLRLVQNKTHLRFPHRRRITHPSQPPPPPSSLSEPCEEAGTQHPESEKLAKSGRQLLEQPASHLSSAGEIHPGFNLRIATKLWNLPVSHMPKVQTHFCGATA